MTRHNVGFMVVEQLAERLGVAWKSIPILRSKVAVKDNLVIAEPQTFMNLSGMAVKSLKRHYQIVASKILVISDDVDLPLGKVRFRERGSSGGQKGLKDIQDVLGTQEIARLRIGIGRPSHTRLEEWVLGRFDEQEKELLQPALELAQEVVEAWLTSGAEAALRCQGCQPPKLGEQKE